MTIYFSLFIIGIWKYLQKYCKMTWLKHAFGTTIYTKTAIASKLLFTGCTKQILVELVRFFGCGI